MLPSTKQNNVCGVACTYDRFGNILFNNGSHNRQLELSCLNEVFWSVRPVPEGASQNRHSEQNC